MAFGNESSAAKSARVKLQLRDKKGRWIEMGGGVKWYSPNLGKYMFGKVMDSAGNGIAVVEVQNTANKGKPLVVNIPASQLEKVKAKASLSPGANEKIDPVDSVDSKSDVKPLKDKNNALFEDMHKNPANHKEPFGANYEPTLFDPKGENTLEKGDLVTYTDSGVYKKGQVIGFQDSKPIVQPEVSPSWGFGGKGSIQPLINIDEVYKPVGSDSSNAKSPDQEAKDVLVPDPNKQTEEAEQTPDSVSHVADVPEAQKDALGNATTTVGNVKVTANPAKEGSFYLESADGKDLAVSIADLKPGDKVYPIGTAQKPYGDHANYGYKGAHVDLTHPAGTGTVTKAGPNYASVEGSDGKTYYPTNKFKAIKANEDSEAALGQIAQKYKGAAISSDEAKAIQDNKDNITQKADDLLENGIKPTEKNSAQVEKLVDAEEGSAVIDGPGLTDTLSTIVYKKKPDGTWISLGGTTKTSEELAAQVPDGKLVSPKEYDKYLMGSFMTKQKTGQGVSDNTQMFEKNSDDTWSEINDPETKLTVEEVTNKLNTDEPLMAHTPEEVQEKKDELTPVQTPEESTETPIENLPAPEPGTAIEEFGKVYSDDKGEYMIGSNGAKFRKGQKVITSKGKGEESEILALYEGVQSARVLLPDGKKSIKKINTLVHADKSLEDNTAAPEADLTPKSQGKPSAMKKQADEAQVPEETPVENPDESVYDDSMPTNPAPAENAPVDDSEEEPTVSAEDMPELEQAAGPIDTSTWNLIKSSSGSNPGGEYAAPDGTHYFVKQSKTDRHAKNEILASDIYQAAGVHSLELGYANVDGKGKLGTIAPMLDGAKDNFESKLGDPTYKKAFQEGWAVDAWLGNWDVAGLHFDNAMTDKDGKAVRVDPGGALLYRAMGSPKTDSMFTDEVTEWDSMRTNPDNYQSYKVFNDMTDQQIVDSVNKVAQFTDSQIDALVDKHNFDEADSKKLKQKLKARRDDLINKAAGLNLEPTPLSDQNKEESDTSSDEVPLADWEKELLKPAQVEDDGSSSQTQEEFDDGLADWEKELLNSAIKDAGGEDIVSEEEDIEPEVDYSKPGTTYKSPYNGEDTVTGKNGKPVFKGVEVTYTKKGETKTGKVGNILVNQQSASVNWPDGTHSIIKGSQLNSNDESNSSAPKLVPATESKPAFTEPSSVVENKSEKNWTSAGTAAKDLPIGSSISPEGSTYKLTKTDENTWKSNGGFEYSNQVIDDFKDEDYILTVPSTSSDTSSDTFVSPKPDVNGITEQDWTESNLNAEDVPVGSFISTEGSMFKLTKQSVNKWVSGGGFEYDNAEVDGLKTDDAYKLTTPSSDESNVNTVAESETPSTGKQAWNDSMPSASELPIGTLLISKSMLGKDIVYKKTGFNTWNNTDGPSGYSDSLIDSVKTTVNSDGTSKYEVELPSSTPEVVDEQIQFAWDSNSNLTAGDLPIGTVLGDAPNSGYKKTDVDQWTSNAGTGTFKYPDSQLDIAKETGTEPAYYQVFLPKNTSMPEHQEPVKVDEPKENVNTNSTSQDDIDSAVEAITTNMSEAVDNYFDQYQENASWEMFTHMFDDGEIDVDNAIFIDNKKYFVNPAESSSPDSTFELLDEDLVAVATFKANSAYGSYNPSYFKEGLLKAIKDSVPLTPPSPAVIPVIPPAPEYKDPNPKEMSIVTINGVLNEWVSEIGEKSWSQIKNMEPAAFATNDGETMFFLQAHPMSTPYFPKFQLIDENGTEVPTEKELLFNYNMSEIEFTGNDILEGIEKVLSSSIPTSETFDLTEGTKLSDIDYKDFAALPAGTQINYLLNNKVYGTYVKNTNNTWRFKQVGKEKPSHQSDSNADFMFIMENNPEMAANYQIFGPEAPKTEEFAPVVEEPKFVFKNFTVNEEMLDGYPIGTTVKTEESSYYNQKKTFVYEKTADGWKQWKKGSNSFVVQATVTTANMSNSLNWNDKTVSVSIPQSDDHVMLGNGEIAYPGSGVYSADSTFGYTIDKINKSYINLIDSDGNKVKLPSKKLFMNSDYGVKAPSSSHSSSSKYDTSTHDPLLSYLETAKAEKAAANALIEFAGASSIEYDKKGLGLKVSKNATEPKSLGLSVVEISAPDPSHPLYGQPKPVAPESPDDYPSFDETVLDNLPKWDSAEWLKGVEERYAANPNKKFDTVQKSTQWNKIQAVLDGHPGWVNYLDQLQGNKYVDESLYKMAVDGIKKQEELNKPLKKAHNENVLKEKAEYEANKAVYFAEFDQKMSEFNTASAEWAKVNTDAGDLKILPNLPKLSNDPFTGGNADWTKAHPGTWSVQTVMDSIREDNVLGKFGLSSAVDSDRIEENRVEFQKVLSMEGQESFEVTFKVTSAFGKLLNNKFKASGDVQKSTGIWYNQKTNMMGKPDNALAKIKGKPSDSKFVNSGNRYEYKDAATGATVAFQHAAGEGQNVSINNNSFQIIMPKDATPADFQTVLENIGINAKPATAGALRVTAENKLMTLFSSKSNWGDENFSAEKRTKTLQDIKEKFNVTVDDVVVETDANGRMNYFLTDAKADELAAKFPMGHIHHSVYAGEDLDVWESMLAGTNPGLLSNYHRGNYGIGVLKSGSGMSPDTDMGWGSGDYLFSTVYDSKPSDSAYGSSIAISPKAAIRRLDIWANMSDNYGKKDKGAKSVFDIMHQYGHFHEIEIRDSVPISDFRYVSVGSQNTKKQLIKRLNDKGIFMINNQPLEQFILSAGESTPGTDVLINKMGVDPVDITTVPASDVATDVVVTAPAVGGPAV